MPGPFIPAKYDYGPSFRDQQIQLERERERQGMDRARSSATFSDALHGIGGAVGGYFQDRAQKKQADVLSKQDAAFSARLESGQPLTDRDVVKIYGPEKGMKIYKSYAELRQAEKPDVPTVLHGLKALSPEMRTRAWGAVRERIVTAYGSPELVPEQYHDQWFNDTYDRFNPKKQGDGFSLSPGQVRFGADGQQIAAAPEAPPTAKLHKIVQNGPNGTKIERMVTEDELRGGLPAYQEPKAAPAAQWDLKETGDGFQPYNSATGELRPSVAKGKGGAVSDAQRTSAGFYQMGKQALDNIAKVEEGIDKAGAVDQIRQAWPDKYGGNMVKNAEMQQYAQAQRAFAMAHLRKESGATISDVEMENEIRTYFRQPGDSPAVLAQKKKDRERIIENLRVSGGAAAQGNPKGEKSGPPRGEQRMIQGQLAEWNGSGWEAMD